MAFMLVSELKDEIKISKNKTILTISKVHLSKSTLKQSPMSSTFDYADKRSCSFWVISGVKCYHCSASTGKV